MTGFDGLVEARQRQLSNIITTTPVRRLPGSGRGERQERWYQSIFHALSVPEEIITKAIGTVISDDPRLQFGYDSNYHTQANFADLFRDQGVAPGAAAIAGIVAAIANPIDPLNKLGIGAYTKLGKAAHAVETAGDALIKGADGIATISKEKIFNKIAEQERAIKAGEYTDKTIGLAKDSVNRSYRELQHIDELNELLTELQKRGTTIDDMKLGASTFEQIRMGQRHLLGFSSPFKMDQLSMLGFGRGPLDNTSVFGWGGKSASALVEGVSNVSKKVTKPLGDAAYRVADKLGIPTIRTKAAKEVDLAIRTAMSKTRARTEELSRDLESIYRQFLDGGGTKEELLEVLQRLETKHSGYKAVAIAELEKLPKPDLYYHGTDELYELDPAKAGGMIWFSKSADIAGQYARKGGLNGKVLAKQLALNNPLDLSTEHGRASLVDILSSMSVPKDGAHNWQLSRILNAAKKNENLWFMTKNARANWPAWESLVIPELKKKGYDGLIMDDAVDTGVSYAVFNKSQIITPKENKATTLVTGKGVSAEPGTGLTDEQKIRLTQSGVSDAEIPHAVSQFNDAVVEGAHIGDKKQFHVKLLGKYIVAKTAAAIADNVDTEVLDAIYGNRIWARHTIGDEAYLVQARMPFANRVKKTSDVEPVHVQNLQRIVAQVSNKGYGLTRLEPEDILVSSSGAVQVINPSVFAAYKSQKEALSNSRVVMEAFADKLGIPKGASREFHFLKGPKAAKRVPMGVTGLEFRVVNSLDISEDVAYISAHDLLEQAANTEGFKDVVRASYDQVSPMELAQSIGDPRDFERANNIEHYRKIIREARDKGIAPEIEPIAVVVDDLGNLHIANGRARLTAAILEGYDAVPIHKRSFIGDTVNVERGYFAGSTVKLASILEPQQVATRALPNPDASPFATNYRLIDRKGRNIQLDPANMEVSPDLVNLFTRFISTRFAGKAREARVMSALMLLDQQFGSMGYAFTHIAEIAERSKSIDEFVAGIEPMLQGIDLNNTIRNRAISEATFAAIRKASSASLDSLASRGFLTRIGVQDSRRTQLASESRGSFVEIMDESSNTFKIHGSAFTMKQLDNRIKSVLNDGVTPADIEPYGRIHLSNSAEEITQEVKDFVTTQHPKLADVMEPVKVFSISEEHRKVLKRYGVFVADDANVDKVARELKNRGVNFGVLLDEVTRRTRTEKGTFSNIASESVIHRPEFAFFVTRSGAVVVGTKHSNVKDLLETIFEEGPAYFEEIGVMSTGKIVLSNLYGSRVDKLNVGELRQFEDRIRDLSRKFQRLGLSGSTVLDISTPFDNAVWRAMYGERVTLAQAADSSFRLRIPDELKNHAPDSRILAPARGGDDPYFGVVAIEKTRLSNERLQKLFKQLEDFSDKLFLDEAKAGLPVSYYASWFGRHLTKEAREALNEVWLKNPHKNSKTFKHVEAFFKQRVLTDLTTQEINTVIKRLQKEGVENATSIIEDSVKSFRDGYILKPTPQLARTLVALAESVPEGIDFFHLDPVWSTHLSVLDSSRAITRQEIVDSLKSLQVALWHGTPSQLNKLKVGKHRQYINLEKEIKEIADKLGATKQKYTALKEATPDLANAETTRLEAQIDELTVKLADKHAAKSKYLEDMAIESPQDLLVDLQTEQAWVRGSDVMELLNKGIVKTGDFIGDPSDVFVRMNMTKFQSALDENNVEVFVFPKEVAGAVQKYFGTQTKDGFNAFLNAWDTVHSLWRSYTLFPIPAYHIRNAVSSFFMGWLGDVTDPRVYEQSHRLLQIVSAHRAGKLTKRDVQEALGAISFASADGKVYNGKEIYSKFVELGGLSGGLHFNEFSAFGNMVRASEFERLSMQAGLRPSSELAGSILFDNAVLRTGVAAAAWTENRVRLAAFIDSLVKGRVEQQGTVLLSGYEAAAMHMKKVFYDYGDLSAFERSWLRRVIPFYSWIRHNVPRMVTTLVTDPTKHFRVNQFFHELEMGATDNQGVSDDEMPDWIREQFGLVLRKTADGSYIVKTGDGLLPFFDAYKVLAGQGILKMLQDGLTPFVKVPIEQLTNYSMFTNREIEQAPGQRSTSTTLGELGFTRRATTAGPLGILNLVLNDSVFKTFFRPGGEFATKVIDPLFTMDDTDSVRLAIMALAIGRAYMVDPEQARASIFRDWETRRRQFVGLRNRAATNGDLKSAQDAERMLMWLTLQYPGNKQRD